MSRSVSTLAEAPARRVPSPTAFVVGLGALPLILLAAIALFELANWDKVTPGVNALGNSVGGMSKAEAVARLTPGVQRLLDRPLDIHGGGQTWHTTARDLGLRLDPNELVGAAYQVGRQGSPFDRLGEQLDTALHGRTVSATSTTDRAALDGSLASMARQIAHPPTDAKLSLSNTGAIQASPAQEGLAVDMSASRDQLNAALNGDGQSVELVTSRLNPAIGDEQLQAAHEQLDRLLAP